MYITEHTPITDNLCKVLMFFNCINTKFVNITPILIKILIRLPINKYKKIPLEFKIYKSLFSYTSHEKISYPNYITNLGIITW